MRAFIALTLPTDVRSSLQQLQSDLQTALADVRWVAPEQLHLTLKFLDDITEAQRRDVERSLRWIAAVEAPFSAQLGALGAFPLLQSPRVLWVGLQTGAEDAIRIAEAIEREARLIGLRQEERPFSAHITLGRVRTSRGIGALVERIRNVRWSSPAAWRVEMISLYQSVLGSNGPRYSVLAEIRLGGPVVPE